MFGRKTPIEKEWQNFLRREEKAVKRLSRPSEPFWEKKLQAVVPEGLQSKLETAFYKAFQVILENGTGAIEKTYSREKLEAEYKTRKYAAELRPVRKNLAAGRRKAAAQNAAGVAGSFAEGAVLGVLGIGLPDIPIFLASVLRSLYTLALQFGIDYEKPEEREFLLDIITLSLSRGEEFVGRDALMNRRIYETVHRRGGRGAASRPGMLPGAASCAEAAAPVSESSIRLAARALSGELLYMKFLQGIPVAGLIGGVYDGICMKRITDYAALKMERRWLLEQERQR